MTKKLQKATFGAGCFWHVEEDFRTVKGVKETVVGFMGGDVENPSYEQVCTHTTGHAEVVQITYDPDEISFEELVEIFWKIHDPTQLNRQGPDVGDQYRSVIFFHTKEQEKIAKKSKEKLEKSGRLNKPIATQIVPASDFWRAEDYHQKYLQKRGLKTCPF
jgi:peptide-methionine (S)-S-oxide reductase